MNIGIKNALPFWVVSVWIGIGLIMFVATFMWQRMDLIPECRLQLDCMIFDFIMFGMHYVGILTLVLGMFVLIGNEKELKSEFKQA